jgi:hypothetical protein
MCIIPEFPRDLYRALCKAASRIRHRLNRRFGTLVAALADLNCDYLSGHLRGQNLNISNPFKSIQIKYNIINHQFIQNSRDQSLLEKCYFIVDNQN